MAPHTPPMLGSATAIAVALLDNPTRSYTPPTLGSAPA